MAGRPSSTVHTRIGPVLVDGESLAELSRPEHIEKHKRGGKENVIYD